MDPTLLGRPVPTPTANKPSGLMTRRTLFIGLGLLAAIIAGMLMMLGSRDNSQALQQRLSARQATTIKVIADGSKNLTHPDLAKLNSELSLVLAGDNKAVSSALAAAGMKKADKSVTSAEADTATFDKLKTAKVNGQYDRTYQSVLVIRLESLRGLLQELHGATKNQALKSALSTEYKHLGTYLEALESLKL